MEDLTYPQKLTSLVRVLELSQLENDKLALEIHAKKTEINFIGMLLTDLELRLTKGNKIESDLRRIREALNLLQSGMAATYSKYLDNSFSKLSITGCLQKCINSINLKFQQTIDFDINVNSSNAKTTPWSKPIYLATYLAIEAICFQGYKKLKIEVACVSETLNFDVIGYDKQVGISLQKEEQAILEQLKGILVWKEATIEDVTDWKSRIAFRILVPKSEGDEVVY